ncbi:MAG TPA: MFS transporter [Ktedonobacterales bacterium]
MPNYSRNVNLILLYTLGKGLQIFIGQVTTNLYVYSLNYPKEFIGLFAAMPAIAALFAGIPLGFLADRIGRKPLLLISGVLNPLALVAIGLSTSAPTLLVFSFLNGVFGSAYWVTILPILTESTSDDEQVGVLAVNSFLLLGVGAIGSLIGGIIPEAISLIIHQPALSPVPLRFGLLAAAMVTFLPVLPLFTLDALPSSRTRTEPTPATALDTAAPHAEPMPQPAHAPQRMERKALVVLFVKLLLPDILATTGEGTVVGLLQLYFVIQFNMQPGSLGALFTLAGLIGGATALNAPRIVRRWGKIRTATTMQYLSAPAMLLTGFAPVLPLAAAGEFSRIVLRGLFDPTYASFTMDQVSTRYRATLSGFYSVTWSLGFAIGPTLAGWLFQHVGSTPVFIVGAICLTSAATLLRIFFGTGSRPSAPHGEAGDGLPLEDAPASGLPAPAH